jgi:hypothetical protein
LINTRKRYPGFFALRVITALRLLPLAIRGENFNPPRRTAWIVSALQIGYGN